MERLSRLFWPVIVSPKNAVIKNVEAISRSQKLLAEMGLVKPAHNGTFQLMPLAQRVFDKCTKLVSRRMSAVGGQQILMPILTSSEHWKKSGRLDGDITEFYLLHDRHGKQFLLSPTHEEAVTALIASISPISYRQLPLRLFQIGPKFRDELKSRFGLIRAKEFIMKDLYTFDRDVQLSLQTYNEVNAAYDTLFRQLEVPFVKVEAATGMMGGSVSHEYHYITPTGEDQLMLCDNCGFAANVEICNAEICRRCKSASLQYVRGIEVAHTFVLKDKYSRPLKATFLQDNGKPEYLVMGCYGIGISRLVAAAVEVLSTEKELRWPKLLAPFDICIIDAKQGSKEEEMANKIKNDFCGSLGKVCSIEEVLIDDRNHLTIGKRLLDAKRMGYPIIVIISGKIVDGTARVELHMPHASLQIEQSEALSEIAKYTKAKSKLLNISADSTQGSIANTASFG
ncbi:probable proline--tRNA ligase, mitochondrial isoform X2 [Eurosta solidaginis]|uniref:probable proline--tRNA ligase, mitochondrial isoform X2 n=1 Tax=Eurosta solidaginis TaxID=178769 RepID=UPI003530B00E